MDFFMQQTLMMAFANVSNQTLSAVCQEFVDKYVESDWASFAIITAKNDYIYNEKL